MPEGPSYPQLPRVSERLHPPTLCGFWGLSIDSHACKITPLFQASGLVIGAWTLGSLPRMATICVLSQPTPSSNLPLKYHGGNLGRLFPKTPSYLHSSSSFSRVRDGRKTLEPFNTLQEASGCQTWSSNSSRPLQLRRVAQGSHVFTLRKLG